MERYFIDLMLEHTHRGNRMGHTFNKQAWIDMLSVFNARFGSQYDKDVLKSRYTNLWKQYNDVKELLGQSGFSWDETRQMVVAEADVWNAYIEVHPEARPYKTKTVLNFGDLCAVFGYTAADGRYSRSSHDLDFDDEVQGNNGGDGTATGPSNVERSRTEWTAAMDQYLIELLLDEIGKGNRTDNSFTKQAWTEMLALFNAKFGPQHDKRILRHRYKKLSKYYSDMRVLLQQNGFSWDERHQMIVPDNDNIWDSYVKAHPHARLYRMKTLPNYNDLVLIFGNATDKAVQNNLRQSEEHEAGTLGVKCVEENGNRTLTTIDRMRTYWTPPMDRYLIDLLLDQVHKGNKYGQMFISQAWVDTATSFNAKFRSYYDKDVLKNRYKHLRRLFNDVKSLLEYGGFSWDETREMITADDHVWDAYTKAHPDARSYRVKTVPNYHKLCVIFGEENSDGRYSHLAQCDEFSSEATVLKTGESNLGSCSVAWQPEMDRYYVNLMLKQVHERNKNGQTFNEQAWSYMVKQFNEKFGLLWDKCILQNRHISLMKECDNISCLLTHKGFSWDANQQMIIADDDVWETYTEGNPDVITHRGRVLDCYIDLCQIQQTGNTSNKRHGEDQDRQVGIEASILGVLPEDAQLKVDVARISDAQRKRHGKISSDSKLPCKVQKTGKRELDTVTASVNRKETKRQVTIENAIEALQAIPEIDDELLFDACDLLEDDTKAKTFMALNAPLRKKWLLRKLRPQESA